MTDRAVARARGVGIAQSKPYDEKTVAEHTEKSPGEDGDEKHIP